MKKTTKVTVTKALTPAKKSAKTVVKTTPVPAAPVEPTVVVKKATPVLAVKVEPVVVAKKVTATPAAKPAPASVVTTISANFDVGFGNALYVRGEGPGLSWEKGLLMSCVSGDTWSVAVGDSPKPFVFKFAINDEVWSGGEDYVAASGSSVTLTPIFPGW